MTQIQAFCELCAVILLVTCVCTLLMSLIESHEYQYPTWKVACLEAPIFLYAMFFFGFILSKRLAGLQLLAVGSSYTALISAFVLRLRIYSTRQEARERARLLAVSAEISKKVESVKVHVMDLMERERLLKAVRPKPKSRYERDPVI